MHLINSKKKYVYLFFSKSLQHTRGIAMGANGKDNIFI